MTTPHTNGTTTEPYRPARMTPMRPGAEDHKRIPSLVTGGPRVNEHIVIIPSTTEPTMPAPQLPATKRAYTRRLKDEDYSTPYKPPVPVVVAVTEPATEPQPAAAVVTVPAPEPKAEPTKPADPDDIVIESGIPLPCRSHTSKYQKALTALVKLKPMQSFLIPASLKYCIKKAITAAHKTTAKRFEVRVVDKATNIERVWRCKRCWHEPPRPAQLAGSRRSLPGGRPGSPA